MLQRCEHETKQCAPQNALLALHAESLSTAMRKSFVAGDLDLQTRGQNMIGSMQQESRIYRAFRSGRCRGYCTPCQRLALYSQHVEDGRRGGLRSNLRFRGQRARKLSCKLPVAAQVAGASTVSRGDVTRSVRRTEFPPPGKSFGLYSVCKAI